MTSATDKGNAMTEREALEAIAGFGDINLVSELEHGLRDIIRSMTDCAKDALRDNPPPRSYAAGVTDKMVEAGARVIAECTRTGIIEAPKLDWPCWMGTSRAIIEAALASRPAPSEEGWQPIETAPKSYTSILLRDGSVVGEGCYSTHLRGWEFYNPASVMRRSPTEWRPLLAPPADRESKPEVGAK